MERRHCHGKHPPPLAPPRRGHGESKQSGASFSASLLDAIYRSLDEGNGGGSAADVVDTTWRSEEKATAPPQFWSAKEAAKPKQTAGADRRRRETAVDRPRHSGYASSTTSSSDSSSSYSFSCSSASTTDTESTHRRHSPPQPEAVDGDTAESAASPNSKAKKKGRPCFPGARLRPRGAAPSSPGPLQPSPATFACVLKTLFTTARLPRKPKTPTAVPPPQITSPALPQPSCTSATSTLKASDVTEATEPRSVRLCPDAEASVVRRRVEELVRSLGDVEEDEEGSDSSSDLFELESLRGADGDELPVYGTTCLAANRAIAQGAVCLFETQCSFQAKKSCKYP